LIPPDKPEAKTKLGKLITEREALGPDDPRMSVYDQAIQKEATRTGMVVESTPEGGLIVRTGVPMGGESFKDLTTKTKGQVEEKVIASQEGLARLAEIEKQFKPEFQEIPTRLRAKYSGVKEKFGLELPEEERQALAEYSEFRRQALNNINLYIKEITGAQMSEKEADRLRKAMPDPGDGLFDGDSPTEFQAKLKGVMRQLRLAHARYNYIRRNGLTIDDVPIEAMPAVINSRGRDLEREFTQANPDMPDTDIEDLVKVRLQHEFGI
jgi:hypothetical protein